MTLLIRGGYAESAGLSNLGRNAHAEGQMTQALGTASHAEGLSSYASALYAHAEGQSTQATAQAAHAEGLSNVASGQGAHAEGGYGTASGGFSHSEGYQSSASAIYSRATGYSGIANVVGMSTHGNSWSAVFSRVQSTIYSLGARTTATTTVPLTSDGSASVVTTTGGAANVILVPVYTSMVVHLQLVGRIIGSTLQSQGWVYNLLVARDGGTARLVGSTQAASWVDGTAVGTPSITASASGYLSIAVTSASSSTTGWFATAYVSEFGAGS